MRTKLIVALLVICTLAIAASASASPIFRGKFSLPYEVHWGRTVLPAGDYSITMEGFNSPAMVRSASGKNYFVSAFPIAGDKLKGGCFLYITANEGQHAVRYLNMPSYGMVLIYKPLTKTETEEIARGSQPQPTQVALARK